MKRNLTIWTLIALLAAFGAACNDGGEEVIQNNDNQPQTKTIIWRPGSDYDPYTEPYAEVFLEDEIMLAVHPYVPTPGVQPLMVPFTVNCIEGEMLYVGDVGLIAYGDYGSMEDFYSDYPHTTEYGMGFYRLTYNVDEFDCDYRFNHLIDFYPNARMQLVIDIEYLHAFIFHWKRLVTMFESITINVKHSYDTDREVIHMWICEWKQFMDELIAEYGYHPDFYFEEEGLFTFNVIGSTNISDSQKGEIDELNQMYPDLNIKFNYIAD